MGISEENVSKLRDYIAANGNVIKNFKVLCEIMNIQYINKGKGFKTQREELECFIKWKKEGHKIIIEEIFEKPFKLVKNPRSTYATSIEYILVAVLKNEIKGEKACIRCRMVDLSSTLGFWNEKFWNYRYKQDDFIEMYDGILEELLDDFEIDNKEDRIKDGDIVSWLYEKSVTQSKNIIKRNLKNLQEKQVIDVEEIYQVQCSGFGPDIDYYVEPSNQKEWEVIQKCKQAADGKYIALLNDKFEGEGKRPIALEIEHNQLMYYLYVNGMIQQYYESLHNFYDIMYKKEKILSDGRKFRRIIPAYKISYKSKTEYKDVNLMEEMLKLNRSFAKSIYNSFKKQRKQIVNTVSSDDNSITMYSFINDGKIDLDMTRNDFDRTEYYNNTDLYCIKHWMQLLMELIPGDYDDIFESDMEFCEYW